MNENKIITDLFQSMELIAEKKINEVDFPSVLVGTVVERVFNSDAYIVSYLNTEITASSMGGLFLKGDEVFILAPRGLNKTKFILGKTSNRTPTFTYNAEGLSEKDLQRLQEIVDAVQDMSSDNLITPVEKQSLSIQWQTIQKSYQEVLSMRDPYSDEIDSAPLTSAYLEIERLFVLVLADTSTTTSIEGENFREKVSMYLNLDKAMRISVQEALREEITYKVDIISSNGESFKNSVIDTNLSALIFRGKDNITINFSPDNIRWIKLNGEGQPIPGWSRNGQTVNITQEDVESKQIFKVGVYVEEAEVAQDIVTIVDLNDIGALSTTVTASLSKSQVYQPKESRFVPDYETTPILLSALGFYGGKEVTSQCSVEWYYNNTKIVSDTRFTIANNSLTIKKNLMNADTLPNMKIRASIRYYHQDYQIDIDDQQDIDFSCVKDGETPIVASIFAPKGTMIKNEGMDLSATTVLRRGDEILTPDSIEWLLSEDSLVWRPISLSQNMSTIAILRETINGVLHIKSISNYKGEKYESQVVSFSDLLDSVNVSIIGSGFFKDYGTNTYTADIFLGQELVEDPESVYDIVWSITNETARASLFNTSWPKRGKRITVSSDEVPDNSGVALTINVLKRD